MSGLFLSGIEYGTYFVVLLASFFCIRSLIAFRRLNKSPARTFMTLFCSGVVLFTIAELLYFFMDAYPGVPDIFYVLGTVFFIGGFIFLLAKSEKHTLSRKDAAVIVMTIALTFAFLGYLFASLVFPYLSEFSLLENILNFFYPITSAIMFLILFVYLHHTEQKGGYLFYIATSFFIIFLGDMMYTYAEWGDVAISTVYNLVYLFGYLVMLFGIYLFWRRLKCTIKHY